MFQVLLCITNNSIQHQSFVSTPLSDQTLLFQAIQFSLRHLFALSLNVKQFYLIYREEPIRCNLSRPELIWERWQWKGTSHSPKLQHYWSLTIFFLSYPGNSLWVGLTPLQRCSQCIVQPQPTHNGALEKVKSHYHFH